MAVAFPDAISLSIFIPAPVAVVCFTTVLEAERAEEIADRRSIGRHVRVRIGLLGVRQVRETESA
jgi:hypothetical protein